MDPRNVPKNSGFSQILQDDRRRQSTVETIGAAHLDETGLTRSTA